ncbi:MAG: LicD family protein [Lachnospiraceae bacterium]|nr:LicD family protein [Lachnospiraceae bacterium]
MNLSTFSVFKNLQMDNQDCICLEGEVLKKLQKILLDISKDIIEVCEQNNITYALCGGSALGAVRHKGFIPWDDDMDLFILGSEREKFLNCFEESFGDKYWIHTCRTDDYGLTMGKIRLKGTICRGKEDIYTNECGIFVDIFWIENTFDNIILRNIHGVLCMGAGFLLSCRNFYKNRDLMTKIMKDNEDVRFVFRIKIGIGRMLSFLSVKRWTMIAQWCYGLCKKNNSQYVSVPSGRKHFFGELNLREDLAQVSKCEFEGYDWNVPKNVKKYLQKMYGDYMKIPSIAEREKHVLFELEFPKE